MNKKLKCLLLDDEMPGLTYLRMICEQIPQVQVVKAFNDPMKLVEEMPGMEFDFCIMDIEMPGLSGLQVAQLMNGKPVVFTTAYKEYAADAFELDAVDYICKPLQKDRLEKAIQRVSRYLENDAPKTFTRFNANKGKALLFFDQIGYITTSDTDKRDKQVVLKTGEMLVIKNTSFQELNAQLPESLFCQINKKEIIAIDCVRYFSHDEIVLVIPSNGKSEKKLSLNESYRSAFLQKTGK